MLSKKLLKIARQPSAVSQNSAEGNESALDGTASEAGESVASVRPGLFSRKGSVWSQVATRLSKQKESQKSTPLVPRIRYENTYRLQPEEKETFDSCKVRDFVGELLEMRLKTEKYNPRTVPSLTVNLSDVIKARVKKMGFKRYKIVCHLVIGEQNGQDVNVASRCVWDPKIDSMATAKYTNSSLYAVATVYAVYFE
ncbi:dynein light chain Tctex-type protein 2B-like [Diadema setosum]|uniref:dynein light chain Tctex-type protein 2B-like n=1 Tax=Diadema setosum TaxID=31175 RepID=UPI003B3AF7B6